MKLHAINYVVLLCTIINTRNVCYCRNNTTSTTATVETTTEATTAMTSAISTTTGMTTNIS